MTRAVHQVEPVRLTVLASVVGLLVTVAVAGLPFLGLAYREPVLHVVLETAEAVVALVVAYLLYGRYVRTGQARALLLSTALLTVALANLTLQALPRALAEGDQAPWASLVVRLVGVGLLTAAALVPPTRLISRRAARAVLVGCGLLVVVLGLATAAVGDSLPDVVDPDLVLGDGRSPVVGGHPLVLAAQVVSGTLYAVACVAYTREASRTRDELLRWLGAGCALAVAARVNYLLFPSLYSDYVYTGDLLRLGFYLCLLVGAAREVRSYWESQAYVAVLEDRRRLARDLHDGLTQELGYIASQSRLLQTGPDAVIAERIHGASARAIDEARNAIAALTRTGDVPFDEVLRQSVDGLAGRYGTPAQLDVAADLVVTPDRGDAVLRIVAEAYRNAVRHGRADRIDVQLTGPPLRLIVQDDGVGGDLSGGSSSAGGGFGLISMGERAEGTGGELLLESTPGAGTRVEVRWT